MWACFYLLDSVGGSLVIQKELPHDDYTKGKLIGFQLLSVKYQVFDINQTMISSPFDDENGLKFADGKFQHGYWQKFQLHTFVTPSQLKDSEMLANTLKKFPLSCLLAIASVYNGVSPNLLLIHPDLVQTYSWARSFMV